MRRSATLSIAAVSLVAVLGGTLVIGPNLVASATPTRPDPTRRTVLHLTAETDQFAVIDVGSMGPTLGLGDQIVSTDRLSHHGQPAGRSGTIMTVVGTTSANLTTQVVTTLDLLDGQIVLLGIGDGPTGPPTTPINFTLAVTGGTGSYKGARGSAEIVDRPGGIETLTIRLTD